LEIPGSILSKDLRPDLLSDGIDSRNLQNRAHVHLAFFFLMFQK
jgi:hypothetical protein